MRRGRKEQRHQRDMEQRGRGILGTLHASSAGGGESARLNERERRKRLRATKKRRKWEMRCFL